MRINSFWTSLGECKFVFTVLERGRRRVRMWNWTWEDYWMFQVVGECVGSSFWVPEEISKTVWSRFTVEHWGSLSVVRLWETVWNLGEVFRVLWITFIECWAKMWRDGGFWDRAIVPFQQQCASDWVQLHSGHHPSIAEDSSICPLEFSNTLRVLWKGRSLWRRWRGLVFDCWVPFRRHFW